MKKNYSFSSPGNKYKTRKFLRESAEDRYNRTVEAANESVLIKSRGNMNSYTWSFNGNDVGATACYCAEKYFEERAYDSFNLDVRNLSEVKNSYTTGVSVMVDGSRIYGIDNMLIYYGVHYETITIKSDHDLTTYQKEIQKAFKKYNPFKGLNIMVDTSAENSFTPTEPLNTTFKDIILKNSLKEDIYDNTLFHMQKVKGNNGIILHGPPGVGKSLIASAIVHSLNKSGITTLTIVQRPDFKVIDDYLNTFVDEAGVVLEDVDSYSEEREDGYNPGLGEFLQFMNGLGVRKQKLLFIATTNYIEHLDKALKSRPLRFNRIFKINNPSKELQLELFNKYMGPELEKLYKKATHKDFTGAHIKEIQRTCEMLSLKRNTSIEKVFNESVELVKASFSLNLQSGFGFMNE